MEEMNTIEMQAQESAAGTAGYAESTAPAGPEAPQGDLGGADNEGTGARRQTPEENARFAAMRRRQEAQQREERLFHELVGDARNPETGMPFASKAECALPGFVDSKNEEKTERNAGYLVVSHSGGGMLRQGTRKGIRRTPANRGMRAHWIVKSLDISEDVCHGLCP